MSGFEADGVETEVKAPGFRLLAKTKMRLVQVGTV